MSASRILLPLGSRIASVAGTAACVVAGAIAGQSVHRVPEGHHVVVRPHAELCADMYAPEPLYYTSGCAHQPHACRTYRRRRAAHPGALYVPASGVPYVLCTVAPQVVLAAHLPTSVLPPGWHLCPRLLGLHQAVLVPTAPSDHSVIVQADTKPGRGGDCFRVEITSTLVVAPDVGQLASDSSAALGGPQLVDRAVEAVGRVALTTLAAACTAPELAAPGEA